MIDSIVFYLALVLIALSAVSLIPGSFIKTITEIISPFSYFSLSTFSSLTLFIIIQTLSVLVIYWLYFALFESSKYQATPGKLLLGIKIVNKDGNRLNFNQAVVRSFIKALTVVTLKTLFVVCLFTKNKQNLHDFAGKTYVIYKNSEKNSGDSDKVIKVFVIIILAIQLIYISAGLMLFKKMGVSWNDIMVLSFDKSGENLDWQNIQLPDAKLSLMSPVNFTRDDKEKYWIDNIAISEAVCYESNFSVLFQMDIQYVNFLVDITPEEVINWFIDKNAYKYMNAKLKITEIEVDGIKALEAVGERFNIVQYRIVVIPETKNSFWIINDRTSSRSRKDSEQIIQKVIDSIKINNNEVEK